jgi:hypothetical protein
MMLFLVVTNAGPGAVDRRLGMYDHGMNALPQAEKAARHGRLP